MKFIKHVSIKHKTIKKYIFLVQIYIFFLGGGGGGGVTEMVVICPWVVILLQFLCWYDG